VSLPDNNLLWPPAGSHLTEQMLWDALYAGHKPGYKGELIYPEPDLASIGTETDEQRRIVRSGFAGVIAQISADYTFGAGINFRVLNSDKTDDNDFTNIDDVAQDLLDDSNLLARLHEAEEKRSAYGDVFITVVADPAIAPTPYINTFTPLVVDPVFVDGHLAAATMWTDIRIDSTKNHWRWLMNVDNRTKKVKCGLYYGTQTNLGSLVPSNSIPQTAGFSEEYDFPEGVERMVWHVPNARPNRRRPSSPYGRSDFQGAEAAIMSTNIVLTSLISDVRLGRARILVPTGVLTNYGLGQGSAFNASREVFTQLDVDPLNNPIQLIQGVIRADEHKKALQILIESIANVAGYSPSTFGLNLEGLPESGAALRVREAKTLKTIGMKRKYWTPVIRDICFTLLQLGKIVYGIDITPVRPMIIWPEIIEETPADKALTLCNLKQATAVSIETLVRMAQPNIDEDDVAEEVARIYAEQGIIVDEILLDSMKGTEDKVSLTDVLNDSGSTGAKNSAIDIPNQVLNSDSTLTGSAAGTTV
jgi:hypothetical protein